MQTPIDQYIASYAGEPRGGVVKDVAFNRKSFDNGKIHNPDQGQIYTGTDGIEVTLEQDFRDEDLQHFFSYAINATRGIDPRNPPDETDWEEMMRGGLQTALKRINIAFAVYGASRTATHQIVRSTRANFHQQSQRAHYYGDRPSVRMPESWLGKTVGRDIVEDIAEYDADATLYDLYCDLAEHAALVYRIATDAGVSYQDARFALLEGTTNFILCEYSLDEFINVYAYRACSMFQWEIVSIVRKMREVLVAAHPWLAPYIKISCEKTKGALDRGPVDDEEVERDGLTGQEGDHTCTFQGWEEVEGQCDFPWARESNRSFRSERHVIKRKQASSPQGSDDTALAGAIREGEEEARERAAKAREGARKAVEAATTLPFPVLVREVGETEEEFAARCDAEREKAINARKDRNLGKNDPISAFRRVFGNES